MDAALINAFLRHRNSLIWSVKRIVGDAHTAEDVAQEAFLRARKALEHGPIDHIEAFLHKTARNLAIDYRRHSDMRARIVCEDISEGGAERVVSSEPTPEACVIHCERLRLLNEAVQKLPKRAQTVWFLSRVEKWPYPKIAEHLGVSPNTVFNDFKLAHAHCVAAMAKIDRS